MATTTYFITGASRGLGLEFARQLLAGDKGARVIAAVRNPATANELQKLIKSEEGRIVAVKLDVSDRKSVAVRLGAFPCVRDSEEALTNERLHRWQSQRRPNSPLRRTGLTCLSTMPAS